MTDEGYNLIQHPELFHLLSNGAFPDRLALLRQEMDTTGATLTENHEIVYEAKETNQNFAKHEMFTSL